MSRAAPAISGALLLLASGLAAQAEAPIADNSFLVEEAYNQEPRVVQHIGTFDFDEEGSDWSASFTQEWPAPGQRHQLSYTLTGLRADGASGWGDLLLNYRHQLRGADGESLAVAPRLSLLLPTGDVESGHGLGAPGLQVNLPVSGALAPALVGHLNLGGTFVPDAEAPDGSETDVSTLSAAASLVWLARPKLNLLFEAAWTDEESPTTAGRAARDETLLLSPGVRFAIDRPSGLQIVPGVAVPVGIGPSDGDWSIFLYLSLEHPF